MVFYLQSDCGGVGQCLGNAGLEARRTRSPTETHCGGKHARGGGVGQREQQVSAPRSAVLGQAWPSAAVCGGCLPGVRPSAPSTTLPLASSPASVWSWSSPSQDPGEAGSTGSTPYYCKWRTLSKHKTAPQTLVCSLWRCGWRALRVAALPLTRVGPARPWPGLLQSRHLRAPSPACWPSHPPRLRAPRSSSGR